MNIGIMIFQLPVAHLHGQNNRQGLPKVCVHLFHSQNKDQCWIFWALLVQFRLGIVCQEGF